MTWTKPGLERRGELNGSTHPTRRKEAQRLTYAMLLRGYGLNWRTGRVQPLQILAPPKVNNVEGAEFEWVTVDETHNWTTHA